jgi:glycine/D-amino acid oxidase-like deaminating enzyme
MTIRIPSMETFDKIISRGVYILPLGNYLYTVGSTYNRVDFTDKLTEEGQAFLKDKIDEILDVEYEVVGSVAGVRPTVKDRKPLIGKHPENDHICVFNGLGARGVLMGPYFSAGFSKFLISPAAKRDSLSFETIDRFSK